MGMSGVAHPKLLLIFSQKCVPPPILLVLSKWTLSPATSQAWDQEVIPSPPPDEGKMTYSQVYWPYLHSLMRADGCAHLYCQHPARHTGRPLGSQGPSPLLPGTYQPPSCCPHPAASPLIAMHPLGPPPPCSTQRDFKVLNLIVTLSCFSCPVTSRSAYEKFSKLFVQPSRPHIVCWLLSSLSFLPW